MHFGVFACFWVEYGFHFYVYIIVKGPVEAFVWVRDFFVKDAFEALGGILLFIVFIKVQKPKRLKHYY